jgi:acetolactate synthase-1/2/3 large subunit
MYRTGAEITIDLLERQGVRLVAGIPGGTLLPLYDALGKSRQIRHILARHEQAAGFIAQGVARISGRPGVCFATSGPGVTNMVTALADAKLDSVPLVCIAGQVPQHLIGTDAFQEVPTLDMVRPITKAAFFVSRPEELFDIIPEAFRQAQSGRPGPVLIDLPKDVQTQPVSVSTSTLPVETHSAVASGRKIGHIGHPASPEAFDSVAALLHAAERPLLYVGGGVVKAGASGLLCQLAEKADIPVTTTLMALGALPAGHRLLMGMLGMHGARWTNQVIEECDLLLAIGARFDDRATGEISRFASNARIIHIDIDPREIGKIKRPEVGIVADARAALAALLARTPPAGRPTWHARIERLKALYPLQKPQQSRLCSPYGILEAVSTLMPADVIVTTDVGQHQMWVAQAFPFKRPDRWLTSGGLGTMGFGVPAAIGAALSVPEATVLCFTGDGSLLMNIQELATLAELQLNVKIVLFDNASLGLVRQQQTLFYDQNLVACDYTRPSDFLAIATAFGLTAISLSDDWLSYDRLQQALASPDPVLIRVPIAADWQVLPMVRPGTANTAALDYRRPFTE